ncbi:MAG: hypothetical protein D6729_04815 [Deltaproteobacteria bacterium]|nr:MAG: hypothetical protein D6729_04815 [Deltaproteobacteria bacterium]
MARRVTGRVRFQDLEGGLWLLEGDDGVRYQLAGGDAGLRKDGQAVEVEGEVRENLMTIGMAGPVLEVHRWRTAGAT